jgi:tetratricopeptide (TPR) repeat protein
VLYNAVFDSLYIEGLCYKSADSADLALERFLECEKIDSKNAALSFELSKVYLAKADSANALSYLKKAYSLDKENYFYAITLAEFYDDSKDYSSAIKIYEKTYKRFPKNKNVLYFLARCYALNGELSKSIQYLDKLENRVGQNKMISVEKSRLYIYDNKHKKAIKVLDDLIKKYPIDADLYVLRGDIKMQIKQVEEALKDYNKALELDPSSPGAQMSLCAYYSEVYNVEQMEYYALKILANESVSFEEKTRYIDFALKLYQNRTDYVERIEQVFETVIKANPESTGALVMYANILRELKNTEKMIEVLHSAVLLDEKCLSCWKELVAGVVYTEENDILKTKQLVNQALKHFPEDAYLLFVEGSILYTEADELGAFESYKKALQNTPAQTKLSEQIYLAISGMQFPEAMMFIRKGIHLYPQNLMLLNNYAYNVAVYWAKNKGYMSEEKLSEFQGILDEAEKISETTVKSDAINPFYLDTYAYILFLQGKYTLAKFYLEQALNYDKEANYEILDHYGDVLNALGEKEAAVGYWRAAYLLNETEELSNKIKQNEK